MCPLLGVLQDFKFSSNVYLALNVLQILVHSSNYTTAATELVLHFKLQLE